MVVTPSPRVAGVTYTCAGGPLQGAQPCAWGTSAEPQLRASALKPH